VMLFLRDCDACHGSGTSSPRVDDRAKGA
jgi:hypothetical protein